MRSGTGGGTGEEYSELAELSGYGGAGALGTSKRYGDVGAYHGNVWRPSSSAAAEVEDILGHDETVRGHSGPPPARPRSGLYYSPPGTSYTIIERPSSALHHHRDREYAGSSTSKDKDHYSTLDPRGTYLGSNPKFSSTRTLHASSNNKKRPISPEQVLRLFGTTGNHTTSSQSHVDRGRRSPASSPPSTTHNCRPLGFSPSIHELTTRTVTMTRDPQDPGFGICVKGGKDAGVGVYISRVEDGSVAERSGLRPGDSILEVNGKPFTGISHEEALKLLEELNQRIREKEERVNSHDLTTKPFGDIVGKPNVPDSYLIAVDNFRHFLSPICLKH